MPQRPRRPPGTIRRRGQGQPGGIFLLSPREWQVCQCVARGMLNKQIAAELGTAEQTVRLQRSRAMTKLSVTSVAELVRLMEQLGSGP